MVTGNGAGGYGYGSGAWRCVDRIRYGAGGKGIWWAERGCVERGWSIYEYRDLYDIEQGVRIRGFPHVEGNFALHVFIPVRIPSTARKLLASYVKKVASAVSGLYVVDVDFALNELCKDDQKLEQMLLGREFHISLGRTVPIQAHQINSIVAMLQQKFQSQRRYQIDFNKWDVFVNDDQTRSFISLEVTGEGLAEISRQIRVVDEIYRLHGLPEFYKNPRPHISLVWAPGHISVGLKKVVAELDRVPNRPIYENEPEALLVDLAHAIRCYQGGLGSLILLERRLRMRLLPRGIDESYQN
ncbi:uncharacterized protein A4U43_C04F31610, partial [Asparagus officinalis]